MYLVTKSVYGVFIGYWVIKENVEKDINFYIESLGFLKILYFQKIINNMVAYKQYKIGLDLLYELLF